MRALPRTIRWRLWIGCPGWVELYATTETALRIGPSDPSGLDAAMQCESFYKFQLGDYGARPGYWFTRLRRTWARRVDSPFFSAFESS